MKMNFTLRSSLAMLCLLHAPLAMSQLYLEEMDGYSYKRVIDPAIDYCECYVFSGYDEDENLTGVKKRTESEVGDPDMASFYVTQDGSCGNCAVFVFDDGSKEYFVQDHIMGDFWLLKTDKNYNAKDTTGNMFYREAPTEEITSDTGIREILATAETQVRHRDWGTRPEESSWVITMLGQSFEVVEVSSVLPEDEYNTYETSNLSDDDPETAWFSDPGINEHYPEGEFITFNGMVYDETIWILNGMQSTAEDFDANARVKKMAVYIEDELMAHVILLDQMGTQQIYLEGINDFIEDGEPINIRFIILETYPGTEFEEAGISEIYTVGG